MLVSVNDTAFSMQDVLESVRSIQRAADQISGLRALLSDLLRAEVLRIPDLDPFRGVTVVRASCHLRSNRSYNRVVFVEASASPQEGEEMLQVSSTAWSLVERYHEPVIVNVLLGEAEVLGEKFIQENLPPAITIGQTQSLQALDNRDTSHVLNLPVFRAGGAIDGMVSIEYRCEKPGKSLPWQETVADLGSRLLVAYPHIAALPEASVPDGDLAVLPVTSSWTATKAPLLKVFAKQRQTLLLNGPTGSGKTRLARWIHAHSPFAEGPFVAARLNQMTDDASLPHLFGWTKGAYTGAVSSNIGWALSAENGTLFLDEIDTLSKRQQQGLLELFDTRSFTVMGSSETKVLGNVRFLIATNANLESLVESGRFREDLYHRINTLAVEVPALDERKDEIPEWAILFAREHQSEDVAERPSLSRGAIALLAAQNYPGNLRDLKATVVRACSYAEAAASFLDGALWVKEEHVHEGLDLARAVHRDDPVSVLRRSAELLVEAADSSPEGLLNSSVLRGKGLLLDMVWFAAVDIHGDTLVGKPQGRALVAKMLGKQKSVERNNYGSELRKACQRLLEFYADHACDAPSWMIRLAQGVRR